MTPAVAALALALAAGGPASAQEPDFLQSVRDLDGAQFFEDEPIWVCDASAPAPTHPFVPVSGPYRIRGREDGGRAVEPLGIAATPGPGPRPRVADLALAEGLEPRPELFPPGSIFGVRCGGLRAGSYRIPARGDTARALARFRVLAPRGSELSVRAALARAARLAASSDTALHADAARLYEAVLARYPRTSYRTLIYAGLWRVRQHTPFGVDPGSWLGEVFAHFHSSCFGVWALDEFMQEVPADQARPLLRHLVGLYPDTKLARAAARYL